MGQKKHQDQTTAHHIKDGNIKFTAFCIMYTLLFMLAIEFWLSFVGPPFFPLKSGVKSYLNKAFLYCPIFHRQYSKKKSVQYDQGVLIWQLIDS